MLDEKEREQNRIMSEREQNRIMSATDGGSAAQEFDRLARLENLLGELLEAERNRSASVGLSDVNDLMAYHPWNAPQQDAGEQVRDALSMALRTVIRMCPRGRYRERAIEAIADARMLANASITFRGRR